MAQARLLGHDPATPARAKRLRSAVLVTGLLACLLAVIPAGPPRPAWATPAPAPGREPLPSATPGGPAAEGPPPRTVSAWLPYWDQEAAYLAALRHADQLHTVSPFWYETKAADRIDPHPGAGERLVVDGLHRAGIKVVPTVMETLPSGVLAGILTDPDRRAAHVDALVAVAESGDYDGLDLDYETIATTGDAAYPAVRKAYASLVTEVCARLHALAKQCVVTVSPQTATTGRIWDYAVLGKAADRMRVMAYNLHYAGGAPGPLASTAWYDELLRTATSLVPPERIALALPAYGWDWVTAGEGRTAHVTWKEAEALRRAHDAPYRLDPVSGTPYFTYEWGGLRREVWYQDARGVAAHLPVLRRHGVVNTALWALNFEDPDLWGVLAEGAAAP
ncbi:glycosyl hydrolase family 18 protein [Streptomyces sp. NPDC053755]|uniref:glycosyl hydrolase family 18 protein n=1 Tax=Streptomyces sp. NPDC053755 TaxID=3155815 RepID=UPI003444BDA3